MTTRLHPDYPNEEARQNAITRRLLFIVTILLGVLLATVAKRYF